MPDIGYVLLFTQLAALVACAGLMWKTRAASLEVQDLVETSRGLLSELHEVIAAADSRLSSPPEVGPAPAGEAGEDRSAAVLGLTQLGLSRAEIAHKLGISSDEASLLLRMAGHRVNERV